MRRALAGVLLLAAPLVAQELPPPERKPLGFLGELLLRARDAGTLGRVEGERWYRIEGEGGAGASLVVVRVRPSDDPPVLVLETVLTTLGQDPAADMHTQVLIAPDGRMHSFRSALRMAGRGEARAQGTVDGQVLRLILEEPGRELRSEERPWDPEAVPGQALMFLVPVLHDQLEADETKLVQFDETSAKLAPRLLRRARSAPGAPGPPLVTLTLAHAVEKQQVQLIARCDLEGRIFELRRERSLMKPIPPDEARALLDRERARPHARPDTPPPPPAPR